MFSTGQGYWFWSLEFHRLLFCPCHVGQFLQASANLCFVKKHFFSIGRPTKNSLAALFIFVTLNSVSNTTIGYVIALKIGSSFSSVLRIFGRYAYILLMSKLSFGFAKCVDAVFGLYFFVSNLHSRKTIP